jgi:hypothetical protein
MFPSKMSQAIANKFQLFTQSGYFYWPPGVEMVFLTIQSGGGGGGRSASNGGGGAAGELLVRIPFYRNGASRSLVTVGAGGLGATSRVAGGNGGNSSFGTAPNMIIAGGGTGGPSSAGATDGGGVWSTGGTSTVRPVWVYPHVFPGVAGSTNAAGHSFVYAQFNMGPVAAGQGGHSFFGNGMTASGTLTHATDFGVGGHGGNATDGNGGNGGPGFVLVEWF